MFASGKNRFSCVVAHLIEQSGFTIDFSVQKIHVNGMAVSADPAQEQSDLGLHCLP